MRRVVYVLGVMVVLSLFIASTIIVDAFSDKCSSLDLNEYLSVELNESNSKNNNACDCGDWWNLGCWFNCLWTWITSLPSRIGEALSNFVNTLKDMIVNAIASALNAVVQPFINACAKLFLGIPVDMSVYKEMGISVPEEVKPYLYNLGVEETNKTKNERSGFIEIMDDMAKIAGGIIAVAMLIGFLALFMERFLVDPGTGVRIIRRAVLLLIFLPLLKYFYHLAALGLAMLVAYIAPPYMAGEFTLPLAGIGLLLLPASPVLLIIFLTIGIIAAVRLMLCAVLAMLLPLLLALELIPFVEGIARRLRDLLVSSMFVVVIGAMCFRLGHMILTSHILQSAAKGDVASLLVHLMVLLAVFTTPIIIAMLAGPAVRVAGAFLAGYAAGAIAGLSGSIAQRFGCSPLWMARAAVRGVARGAGYVGYVAGSLLEMPSRIRRLPSDAVSWTRYQARRIGGALKREFLSAHPELHRRYLGYTEKLGHSRVDYYASMAKTALRRGATPEQVRRALEQQTDKLTAYEAWRKALRELEEEEEEQE